MRSPWFLAAGAALAALTASATPGGAATSSGPTWNPPVLVSATESARETSLVIDPTDNRRQFVCAPSGVPAVGEGQSYFHMSSDGGRTWKPEDVEMAATDTRQGTFEGGDCDVAYDAGGTMYSADTWLGNLSIGHSTDHGETWSGTAVSGTSPVIDRPWLVGGPKGTLYVTYQDVQCCTPSAMWFMKSTDFGRTFTPAVPITTANPRGLFTWEGNFVVSPSGKDLYLVYSRRSSGPVSSGPSPETIWITHSADGGQTWKESLISANPEETTTIYPSLGMDRGGNLHVVWSAPAKVGNPISYTASRDGGRTWSKPIALNPGKVGLAPWIVGGKAGEAAVAWLGSHDPKAKASTIAPYHFFWARVTLPRTSGAPIVRTGTTTKQPLFEGRQVVPEFEMVQLDKKGRMHLGMSVFRAQGKWAVYSQSER